MIEQRIRYTGIKQKSNLPKLRSSTVSKALSFSFSSIFNINTTMEKVNFNYLLENIPLPTKDTYRKNFIHKLERFIKKITWKAFFFENKKECTNEITTNFGFKSVKTPPKNGQLNQFESDLYDMVQYIEFKIVTSNFQAQLSDDVRNI